MVVVATATVVVVVVVAAAVVVVDVDGVARLGSFGCTLSASLEHDAISTMKATKLAIFVTFAVSINNRHSQEFLST